MANRRMFSLDIVDSDAFLSMPISTQNLYFHLGMRADDDGVVDNPKTIKRIVGANDDDLSILIAKKFVVPFEEKGLIVIKHWLINNTIRKDRYVPSKYQNEVKQLGLDENGAYTMIENEIIKEIPQKESTSKLEGARLKRYEEMKNSDLPYSFTYKIRQAFNGKKCPICNQVMNLANDKTMPTIQHNVPISLGGKHEITNISIICKSCNTSIQNRQITDKLNNDEVIAVWDGIGNGNPN